MAGYLSAAEELRKNPGQWEAYESEGSCLVLAGPGSGKTKVLTIKLARILAEDVAAPRGVACITFSTECARELEARLAALGLTSADRLFVGTVHSFCLTQLLLPFAHLAQTRLPAHFRVATNAEREAAYAEALGLLSIERPAFGFRGAVERHRRTVLDRESVEWQDERALSDVVEHWEACLAKRGLIDFDDMALVGVDLLKKHAWVRRALKAQFPVLAIDEYQDLGAPLHGLVIEQLAAGVRVFAVGDPNQSVHGFAGARPELLRDLEAHGVPEVRLRFNYRCAKRIVSTSSALVGAQEQYEPKNDRDGQLFFHACPGGIQDQAKRVFEDIVPGIIARLGCSAGSIAVLFREHGDGDILAPEAARCGYKVTRVGRGAAYPRVPLTRWIEECAAWCAGGSNNGVTLDRIIRQFSRFFEAEWQDAVRRQRVQLLVRFLWESRTPMLLTEWLSGLRAVLDPLLASGRLLADQVECFRSLEGAAQAGGQMEDSSVADFAGQRGSPGHLMLMTMHASKGLEFDAVVMFGMDQGRIPHWNADEDEYVQDRRLFYVALTRAKSEVHMTYSGFRTDRYGRRYADGPSEFLLEVRRRAEEDEAGVS